MRSKAFSGKPRSKAIYSRRDPIIPAVTNVNISVDKCFLRECLKKKNFKDLEKVNWPKAFVALKKLYEEKENHLLHIESVCRKARVECITPIKDFLLDIEIRRKIKN